MTKILSDTDFSGSKLLYMGEESVASNVVITPDAISITGDTYINDYEPSELQKASILRISTSGDGTCFLCGIIAPDTSRFKKLHIVNVGTTTITFKNQYAESSTSARFALETDLPLYPNAVFSLFYDVTSSRWRVVSATGIIKGSYPAAASDEYTVITSGTNAKTTFRMPYAMVLNEITASLTTAQSSGSIFTVNIKKNGTTFFSTKITIDNGQTTSVTATTPSVLSITSVAKDDEITVFVDQCGSTATGLKISLNGNI